MKWHQARPLLPDRHRADSLAALSHGADRYLGLILLASLALLAAGVTLPILNVTRLFILTDQVSILSAIAILFEGGEWAIATVVLLFSVLLPVVKIELAYRLWRRTPAGSPDHTRLMRRLDLIGKWSMLDVLVAALVIVSVKASLVADASTEPGLYLFLASVVLVMYATHRIKQVAATGPGQ